MSRYLITYHGGQMPPDAAAREQAKSAFGQWLQKAGKIVVDPGAPTRPATSVSGAKRSSDVEIGGYSIIEAASLDEAVKILKVHPFVERGGTLQVNELIAV